MKNAHPERGVITFTVTDNNDPLKRKVTAEWEGPDELWITKDLVDQADTRYLQRDGDTLTMCQYKVKILGETDAYYITKRARELEA